MRVDSRRMEIIRVVEWKDADYEGGRVKGWSP